MSSNKIITIGRERRDGKFPVKYAYQGAPNMFGGRYPPNIYNKLHTADKIGEHTLYAGDEVRNNSGFPDSHFWKPEKDKRNEIVN